MVIKDEDFKDVVKSVGNGVKAIGRGLGKANRAARDFANKVKDTYDFYSGKRDSKYNFTSDASDSDLRKTAFKPYAGKFKYKAKKDEKNGVIQLVFDSRAVDKNFADRVRPDHNRSDSLYPFVRNYKDNEVIMEFPMDNGDSAEKMKQKNLDKKKKADQKKESVSPEHKDFYLVSSDTVIYVYFDEGEWHDKLVSGELDYFTSESYQSYLTPKDICTWVNQDFPGENFKIVSSDDYNSVEEESVMTPTPTPYKGRQCDKDGKLINESVEEDAERFGEFYLVSDSGATIYVYKEDGKWYEDFIKGDLNGRPTSYMGYLSPRDIRDYVEQDNYGQSFKIVSVDSYDFGLGDDYEEESIKNEGILDETPGLTLSSPEIVHSGEEDFEGHLEIQINGKAYKYKMKPGTNKLPSEIASTVSKMQKFSDGKALAYLKKNMELTETLREDLLQSDDQTILESVMSEYGVVSDPYAGPSFILPTGEFLDLKDKVKNHADVEKWLVSQKLSPYEDIGSTQGSPSLKHAGCIRVDTPKYYIQLPYDNITSSQYSALRDWLDFLMTCNVPFVEVIAPSVSPVKYYFDDVVDSDYIVGRVRRYYISGMLYEKIKENKNPFKSHHICQGCGNPLSSCICKVATEDEVEESVGAHNGRNKAEESLTESRHSGTSIIGLINTALEVMKDTSGIETILKNNGADSSDWTKGIKDWNKVYSEVREYLIKKYSPIDDETECPTVLIDKFELNESLTEGTRSSSIGQHKSDSIDLIENDEDSQEE